VPREWLGEPIESFLRDLPRGRQRNVATFGRAVRPIPPSDLQRILELTYGGEVDPTLKYPNVGDIALPEATLQERTRRLVEVIQRDARFRDDVFVTYDFRCAISQFAAGRISPSRLGGLLEAAHLRPVRYSGPDLVANGLALTPTLHRLFDAGLFTLRYRDGHLEVETSPALEEPMIRSPDGEFRLPLVTGHRALLPPDHRKWPHPDFLQYHNAQVFVSGSP
jgi:putative restriction endonuclease